MEDSFFGNRFECSFKDSNEATHMESPKCHSRAHSDLINSSIANTTFYQSPNSRAASPFKSRLLSLNSKTPEKKISEFTPPSTPFALSEKLKKIEQEHPKSQKYLAFDPICSKSGNLAFSKEALEIDFSKSSQEIPTLMWCAYCKGEMSTMVEYKNSSKTFFTSLGIFLSGGVFGCFMLPYMTNSCKSLQVKCQKCGRTLSN